jgi:hypothetical protein
MAYEGDIILACPAVDYSTVWAVVVSGAKWNPCGHALLYTGMSSKQGGWYFHVARAYGLPRQMQNEELYQQYLKENGKREITRYEIRLPNPEGAARRLEELVGKAWVWAVLPNNCAAFVEDIVRAGGSSAGLYSNCPRLERFR